jgi:hypothetical protein
MTELSQAGLLAQPQVLSSEAGAFRLRRRKSLVWLCFGCWFQNMTSLRQMLMVIGLYLLRIECANQLGMNQKHRDYPRAPPLSTSEDPCWPGKPSWMRRDQVYWPDPVEEMACTYATASDSVLAVTVRLFRLIGTEARALWGPFSGLNALQLLWSASIPW